MMYDFNFVTNRLATGAQINGADDVQTIMQAGITHVIDAQAERDDAPTIGASHLVYLWNPTVDDGIHPKPINWFKASLDFALPTLAQPGTRVLAHCGAGVNRGPSTAYAILLAMGIPTPLAEDMIRKARPQVGLAYATDALLAVQMLGFIIRA